MSSSAIRKDVHSIIACDLNLFEPELQVLQKIRSYDEYTYLHSLNVARLSVALGTRLGLESEYLVDLGWAALLHDIGKLNVPIQILNKLKKFSPDELAVMKSHPAHALSAFVELQEVSVDGLRRLCAAFEHHQRFDLKGYPQVESKLHLHPYSRIVAVADTFDAMTTDRIYQRRVLPDVALRMMAQGFGTVFDPLVLQSFITAMGAFPVGSLVRLSDQRLAVVSAFDESSEVDRPHILLLDDQKRPAQSIDLTAPEHRHLKIVKSEFAEDHQIDVHELINQ